MKLQRPALIKRSKMTQCFPARSQKARGQVASPPHESTNWWQRLGINGGSIDTSTRTSAIRDHDFPKMPAALKMSVSLFCLGERECPVDHGAQAVHRDRSVHRLKVGAAANTD